MASAKAQASMSTAALVGGYGLELGGHFAGSPAAVEGGLAMSDVVKEGLAFGESIPADSFVRKHLAGVKYSDIELDCGADMSSGFYNWITDRLEDRSGGKDGAVIEVDYAGRPRSRLGFHSAFMTEVRFPAADAASTDAAMLTVRLSPGYTRAEPPSGSVNGSGRVQRQWLQSNFRLKIGGLECTRVSRVQPTAVTERWSSVTAPVGPTTATETKEYLDCSDLIVTFPESDAASLRNWHQDFVINRNNGPAQEKSGTLEFLASNRQDVLFTLSFSGLGIYKLDPGRLEASSQTPRRVTASMYCEKIKFTIGAVAPPPPPPPAPPPQDTSRLEFVEAGAVSAELQEPAGLTLAGEYPGRFARLRAGSQQAQDETVS